MTSIKKRRLMFWGWSVTDLSVTGSEPLPYKNINKTFTFLNFESNNETTHSQSKILI